MWMSQEPEEYFRRSFKKYFTCEGGGGGGGGGQKSATGGGGGSKKSDNSHSNFVGFSFCAAQFFLLCISWSFDNITLSYNKKIIQ